MRGILAGLLIALLVMVIAVVAAGLGAVAVAAIGWVLSRWFPLSAWQGTLVALAIAVGLGYMVFRLMSTVPTGSSWSDEWEDEDFEEEEEEEPPIVPWRRNRPTPGALPTAKPTPPKSTPKKK